MRKKMTRVCAVLLAAVLMFALLPAAPALAATPSVKVTFNANGGKIGAATKQTVSVKKGAKVGKLPTATRTGYNLKGWYTTKTGGTKVAASTKAAKKATYYAQWTAKKYTLKFDANGGKVTSASKKVAYKKGYGDLPTPTRSGHTFQGWYTTKTGGAKVSATTKMPAKNVTVYAQWKKGASSSIDPKLVGHWKGVFVYTDINGYPILPAAYYNFYDDGTFKCWVSYPGTYLTGKYTSTGGKVHFKVLSMYTLLGDDTLRKENILDAYDNSTFEYECSTDKDGKYLLIAILGITGGDLPLSAGTKYRATTVTELDNIMKHYFSK